MTSSSSTGNTSCATARICPRSATGAGEHDGPLVAPKAPSLLRELAHELRDALSPVRSALDLVRLRGFGPEAGNALAPRIEQGLDRALAVLDTFLLAEQCESGALELTVVPVSLARLLEFTLE